jgi:uncharacterized integral membrane protein
MLINFSLLEISMNENYFSDNTKESIKTKSSKKSVSMSTLVIAVVTTMVFVFIVINKWPNILDLAGWKFEDKVTDSYDFNV